MPYETKKDGENVQVINTVTGRVVATHTPPDAEQKAENQIHLLHAVENDPGWKTTHGTE